MASKPIGLTAKDRAAMSKVATKSTAVNAQNQQQNKEEEEQNALNQPSVRNIMGFTDKYDRAEIQELLSSIPCNWLLSIDDFKLPIEHPTGVISQMAPTSDNHILVLMPFDPTVPNLDYRELHQIIRELTIGIYVLNQQPNLILDANFDESTSCQMPPAYIDTKLGQIMCNTDYWLKALWHGAFFPRDKRMKFSERFRQLFDVDANGLPQTKKSILSEFVTAGLQDITNDPDYKNAYDEQEDDEKSTKYATAEEIKEEINFFMSYIDDLALQLTVFPTEIKQYKNLYEIDGDYMINSCVKATQERIDSTKFERLKKRLNKHEIYIRKHFAKKKEVRRYLDVLKLVSFLVPLLIGLKRRMKIPDLNNLLPFMSGDDVRTEREFPPLLLPPDYKCKTFRFDMKSEDNDIRDKYFNLHGGIQFELETVNINQQCSGELEPIYTDIQNEASKILTSYLESDTQLQDYPVPLVEINNKKYYAIRIDIENYYPQYPQKPFWICKLNEDLMKLKPKRLPMSDINIYDLFKKYFGYKKATKFKNPVAGLRASAHRGLMGIYQSFARKTPASRLAKTDEIGLTLLHYAAIGNRTPIITSLIQATVDVNIKQQVDYLAIGPMALHYAARCGSLDSISCLLSNYANISFNDNNGWAPIHHAAFFDNIPAIRLLIRKQEEIKELLTRGEYKWTPVLLASSGGSLEAIKCLMELGANWLFQDDKGYNIIHIAAHRNHTNILEYFIRLNHPQMPATNIVINMLKSSRDIDQEAAVKCLQGMTNDSQLYKNQILDVNGIEQLMSILRVNVKLANKTQQTLTLTALSVLCNLSDDLQVRERLSNINDVGSILAKLIESTSNDDIQSRAAIIIADISAVNPKNRNMFAQLGALDKLIKLLNCEVEDVLVNAINALEVLCKENVDNQNYCAQNGVMTILVDLFDLNSDKVKAAAVAAISAIVSNNRQNQDLAIADDIIKPVIDLLRSRNVTVQMNIALALESLATDNLVAQQIILDLGAAEHMINLLRRMHYVGVTIKANTEDWSIFVREQAACTLWALAGSQKPRRKLIAEKIGILQIIIMLLSKSEKLQYVGCKCVIALVLENINNQKLIAKENGIELLLKLLRSDKTSQRVILTIVQTIAALCIDVAHVNNCETQLELAEKGAFEILIGLLEDAPNKSIKIETAHTIACLLLCNTQNENYLNNKLDMNIILSLLEEPDPNLRLAAGKALAIFAYNNTQKQFIIKELGGVSFRLYENILESDDEMQVCHACFQVVILARIINDKEKVETTALGISKLVNLLNSTDEEVVIQTASYLASLSHTRAGITDAMIACDAVNILCTKLYSPNEQIRFASAVTLGYLTFNRTASRLLLHNCRNETNLYNTLRTNLRPDSKISPEFITSYETALQLGLPKLLVHNKVRFVEPTRPAQERIERVKTAKPVLKTTDVYNRAQSAPPAKIIEDLQKKTNIQRPITQHGMNRAKTSLQKIH